MSTTNTNTTNITPGTWYVSVINALNRPMVRAKNDGHVVADCGGIAARTPEEAAANAQLVAAAPMLLAALRECVAAYEQHRDQQPTGKNWPDPNHIFHAREAIRKADTGADVIDYFVPGFKAA